MTPAPAKTIARPIADAVGITGSLLCALHCLIVPLSLVFGPIQSLVIVDDELFHRALLWVLLPAAGLAFGIGCRQHRDPGVLVLGTVGLLTMTAALTIAHDALGESGERLFAIGAAGLLVAAHVRNFRLCRADARDPCC